MDEDSRVELALDIADPRWSERLPEVAALIERVVRATLAHAPAKLPASVEVAVSLVDDAAIRQLNAAHRGRDRPTNVLSFPQYEAGDVPLAAPADVPVPLGDVVLAFDTVSAEAVAAGRPLEAHVAHLVAHGVLHLLGFDHVAEGDAERMEQLERRVLASLHFPDPYETEVES